MATRIFDNDSVTAHPVFSKAGSRLSEVCARDYGYNSFDERIKCLDMDLYETLVCTGAKQPTMDAVIGAADYAQNRKSGSRLVMVELRMAYASTNHLDTDSLNGKVRHTLEMLNPAKYVVDKQVVFIFDASVYQQAVSWMAQKAHSNATHKEWVVMSPELFGKAYLCEDDLPYEPMYDYAEGKEKFVRLIEMRSWQQVYKNLVWWGDVYHKCYYLSGEVERIMALLSDVWQLLLDSKEEMDEDEILRFDIFAEDYPMFHLEEF